MSRLWLEDDRQELARLRRQRDDFALGNRGIEGDGYRGALFHEFLASYDQAIARLEAQIKKEEEAA